MALLGARRPLSGPTLSRGAELAALHWTVTTPVLRSVSVAACPAAPRSTAPGDTATAAGGTRMAPGDDPEAGGVVVEDVVDCEVDAGTVLVGPARVVAL